MELTRKEVAPVAWEFTGTFFLSFIVTVGIPGASPLVGLAIGLTLAVMVYAGGPISGGHFNPAVSFGCALRGATPWGTAAVYMLAQFFGALLAGGFGRALEQGDAGYPQISSQYNNTKGTDAAFWASVLYTSALVFTVLSVATARATSENNHYFGLAIGSTVFVGSAAVGEVSGAALNPAVGVGLNAANGHFEWVYLLAPFVGASFGSVLFWLTHPDDTFGEAIPSDGTDALLGPVRLALRAYVTEAIGAFFLVLTIGLAADTASGAGSLVSLAIGSILMVMVYSGGHVSGGHYNPAVTLGAWLTGSMKNCPLTFAGCVRPLGYVASQLIGAFVGAGISYDLAYDGGAMAGFPHVGASKTKFEGLLGEAIITFFLVTVVLFTACSEHSKGNSYFGFAIGMTVFVGAVAVGPISGGAFNPAVGTALPAVNGHTEYIWIYWVGPLSGAVAASGFYLLFNIDFYDPDAAASDGPAQDRAKSFGGGGRSIEETAVPLTADVSVAYAAYAEVDVVTAREP